MNHARQTKIRLLHGRHMIHFPHPTILHKSLMTLLQPFRWCCMILHERDVREE